MSAEELAQHAAERVREIVAEAERRAAEIVREAEAEAARIRERAAAVQETPSPPVPHPDPSPPGDPVPTPPAPEPVPPRPGGSNGSEDDAAARLLAMKLALEGSDRDQIASELEAKFGSADRAALLDEVFARAGK